MIELNAINEKYNNFFPCLLTIESNKSLFKKNNHDLIFSFLLGHFISKNMTLKDLNNIFNQYQQKDFNKSEFSNDFKNIAYIFCEYFQNKENPKIYTNNINNINVINVNINNSGINLDNSKTNSNNNKINNSHLGNSNSNFLDYIIYFFLYYKNYY